MPEGDAVYLTAQRLRRGLVGKTLTRCDIRVPRYATVDLTGQLVDDQGTYGKHLFTRIGEYSIHTHLKMEGAWQIYRPGERWRRPWHQARIIVGTNDTEAVGFSLGIVEVLARDAEHDAIAHLGPDLLGPDWDPDEAVRRLRTAPDRPIGLALLDQTNLAGIGNIYRSEVCFLQRVHPATPTGAVPDLRALADEAHRVLTKAAHHPPWRPLAYQRHRRPCRRCGANLVLEVLGGEGTQRERGIYFCPRCQPAAS